MKTKTYLRLSLLIPFLVWGICLLFFMLASKSQTNGLASGQSTTKTDWFLYFVAFYLFGIIIWILPYILVGLILFTLSFINRTRVLIKLFALSPLAMTLLTLSWTNILALVNSGDGMLYSNPLSNNQDFTTFNILLIVISLLWGYICVGIGYGIFRLLQLRQFIRDQELVIAPKSA